MLRATRASIKRPPVALLRAARTDHSRPDPGTRHQPQRRPALLKTHGRIQQPDVHQSSGSGGGHTSAATRSTNGDESYSSRSTGPGARAGAGGATPTDASAPQDPPNACSNTAAFTNAARLTKPRAR